MSDVYASGHLVCVCVCVWVGVWVYAGVCVCKCTCVPVLLYKVFVLVTSVAIECLVYCEMLSTCAIFEDKTPHSEYTNRL